MADINDSATIIDFSMKWDEVVFVVGGDGERAVGGFNARDRGVDCGEEGWDGVGGGTE